jgi:hypothetical protein
MANVVLIQQFNSLLLPKNDKFSIKCTLSNLTSEILTTYRLKLFKNAGIPFKPSQKIIKHDIQAIRKLYLETFEKSLILNKIVASKFINDQKQREKRKAEREESLQRKQELEKQEQERLKQENQLKKDLEKTNRLKTLQEQSEKRKIQLNLYKQLEGSIKYPPLFKQIEETYYLKQQMPELERRKKELETKRELFKPISLSEIRQHAEKSKKILENLKTRKKNVSCQLQDINFHEMRTKFTQIIIEQDKKLKEEPEVLKQGKKSLAEKKKKYGKMVGELYHPSIDKFKEQEMKLIKARLEFPVKFKIRDSINTDCSSRCSRSFSVQQRKWKKNTMVPDPPEERKTGKKILYLEEQRNKREKSQDINKVGLNWEDELGKIEDLREKQSFLKRKARILENQAKNYERFLNEGCINLDVADHVNDLLINSIRAKLSYLE